MNIYVYIHVYVGGTSCIHWFLGPWVGGIQYWGHVIDLHKIRVWTEQPLASYFAVHKRSRVLIHNIGSGLSPSIYDIFSYHISSNVLDPLIFWVFNMSWDGIVFCTFSQLYVLPGWTWVRKCGSQWDKIHM